MFKFIKQYFIKRKIIKLAIATGLDVDGDVIVYKDKKYYIDLINNIIKPV